MATHTAQDKPIIIVGAGISGLAAAAKLGEAGIPALILEARDRIGGRIFTQHAVDGFPVELGAEFIHGKAPEILERLEESEIEEVDGQNWCVADGKLSDCSFFSEVESILSAMDDSHPDQSFLDFLEEKFPNPSHDPKLDEAKRRATAYVSGFNAADPALVSVHWLVAEARAEEKIEGHRSFRSKEGYPLLIDAFRQQIARHNIQIQTSTIVERIAWKPGVVQVKASSADGPTTFETPQALLTLPISLLKAKSVEFTPPLPEDKIAALDKLEMGKVDRVILRFKHRFWGTLSSPCNSGVREQSGTLTDMGFLFSDDEIFPTWWTTMPTKQPLITAWAPFRSAEKLSGKDESAIVHEALQTLSRLLSVSLQNLESWFDTAYFHDWQKDPFSQGAYSYAKVGADGAQERLGQPVNNTLFFAGEATDVTGNNGTVHGAIASGYRAAQQLIKARNNGKRTA
jgi:monoamine oxidase